MTLVIGNNYIIPHSLLAPGATLGSVIINQFGDASTNPPRARLTRGPGGHPPRHGSGGQRRRPDAAARSSAPGDKASSGGRGMSALAVTSLALDTQAVERRQVIQATAAHTLRRRRTAGRVMRVVCMAAFLVTLAPLGLLIGYVTYRGIGAWSVNFFTHLPTPEGIPGGGISNALVGTAIIDGLALAMAVPGGSSGGPLPGGEDQANWPRPCDSGPTSSPVCPPSS